MLPNVAIAFCQKQTWKGNDIMNKKTEDLKDYAIQGGLFDTVARHGSAGAEFLKGLRGIDHETGRSFDRSLLRVAGYKINPDYVEENIKVQAGFSAEIAGVSRKNAEAIINRDGHRFFRSEDLPEYGKNHAVVDIVELMDNTTLSVSQMKFVSNSNELLKKIACGEGGGKKDLSRYLSVDKLEVPSEQVEEMKRICRAEAMELRKQAEGARQAGKIEVAKRLERQAGNYKKMESKITDSGLSTEQAIAYRLEPRWETAKDIAGISHRAGIEGAAFGAAIGGSISVITNIIAVNSGNKEFGDALSDTVKETLLSAGVGYGTAFAGTAAKTFMQQSTSASMRALSKTGLPAAIITLCISTSKVIKSYAKGEIDETQLVHEMGLTTTGMLSASMFTMLGQIAVPVPVLGGMIGGMIGYAITNNFYQGFFEALKEAKLSAERRQIIEMKCAAAAALSRRYEQHFKTLFANKILQLDAESKAMFSVLENPESSADELCESMNRFAEMLGNKISIKTMNEFDSIMLSDDVLKI